MSEERPTVRFVDDLRAEAEACVRAGLTITSSFLYRAIEEIERLNHRVQDARVEKAYAEINQELLRDAIRRVLDRHNQTCVGEYDCYFCAPLKQALGEDRMAQLARERLTEWRDEQSTEVGNTATHQYWDAFTEEGTRRRWEY